MRLYSRSFGPLAAVALLALAGTAALSAPVLGATADIGAKSRKAVSEFVELGKLCKRHGTSYLDLARQLAKLDEGLLGERAGEALEERLATITCLRRAKEQEELLKLLYGDYKAKLTEASDEESNQGNSTRDPQELLKEVFRNLCNVRPQLAGTVRTIGTADTIVQRQFSDRVRGDSSSVAAELVELHLASSQPVKVYPVGDMVIGQEFCR